MEYKLIRSRRKTLSLSIDKDGSIVVRAPYGYPESKINEFISRKRDWIEKHGSELSQREQQRRAKLSEPPASLPLLGEMCPVEHCEPYGYTDGKFSLPGTMTLEKLLPYLRRLYHSIARETLIPRAKLTADRMGILVTDIKINSARTRWGSCSSRSVINLSWKLVAADPSLIDYVIVHELCHTAHMDHSAAFWDMVAQVIPDYKERREALKEVQKLLEEYGFE